MQDQSKDSTFQMFHILLRTLRRLFNLRIDTDYQGTVDEIIANSSFRSANAWTLVFAILIASIGLNVNSTAVIIGAMLISPLMGPIVGIGFSLGVFDFDLLKRSIRNLAIATAISILASCLYFLMSPLSEVQSELLARTKPSFFDVLIAFFGGGAGIVALSRGVKSNAIPGVAIATALMPPLCTVGFALSHLNWKYALGAFYLFMINGVFIAFSTFVFIRFLGFQKKQDPDPIRKEKVNRWILAVVTIVGVPSLWMAWYLQQESSFSARANRFFENELKGLNYLVLDKSVEFNLKSPKVTVTILDNQGESSNLERIKARASLYALSPQQIVFMKSPVLTQIEDQVKSEIRTGSKVMEDFKLQLAAKEKTINEFENTRLMGVGATKEVSVFDPKVHEVKVEKRAEKYHFMVIWKNSPQKGPQQNVEAFLKLKVSEGFAEFQHVVLLTK